MPRPEWQDLEKTIASTKKSKVRKSVWALASPAAKRRTSRAQTQR